MPTASSPALKTGHCFDGFAGGIISPRAVCLHTGPDWPYRPALRRLVLQGASGPQSPGWNGSGFDRGRVWAGRAAKRGPLAIAEYAGPIQPRPSRRAGGRRPPQRILRRVRTAPLIRGYVKPKITYSVIIIVADRLRLVQKVIHEYCQERGTPSPQPANP